MDIMEMTRELGRALQQDDRFIAYNLAKQANDADEGLQADIAEFEKKRQALTIECGRDNADTDLIKSLDTEVKALYSKIMGNRNMLVYNAAQTALEGLVSNMTQIISLCANGENPDTCQPTGGCSGSCASCGGCH